MCSTAMSCQRSGYGRRHGGLSLSSMLATTRQKMLHVHLVRGVRAEGRGTQFPAKVAFKLKDFVGPVGNVQAKCFQGSPFVPLSFTSSGGGGGGGAGGIWPK